MEYSVLTIGISNELFSNLRALATQYKLRFIMSSTILSADQLLRSQMFHLLIIDLDYLRNVRQSYWLSGIRRSSFAPIIVLSDCPEQDTNIAVRFDADIFATKKETPFQSTRLPVSSKIPFISESSAMVKANLKVCPSFKSLTRNCLRGHRKSWKRGQGPTVMCRLRPGGSRFW